MGYIQITCLFGIALGPFTPVATLVGHTRRVPYTLAWCSFVSFAGFKPSVHPLSFFLSCLDVFLGDLILSLASCFTDAFQIYMVYSDANLCTLCSHLYTIACTLGNWVERGTILVCLRENERKALFSVREEWWYKHQGKPRTDQD